MKTLKQIIVLIVCFMLLSTSFVKSSAVGDIPTGYDGAEYDENGDVICYYSTSEEKTYDEYGINMLSLSEPNYSWSPDNIPWSTFPSYIKAIAYSTMRTSLIADSNYYKVPFIMVRCGSTYYQIWAGYNVALFNYPTDSNIRLGYNIMHNTNPILYTATFKKSDNSVYSSWQTLNGTQWGDNEKMFYYSGTVLSYDDARDVYFYGSNGVRPGNYSSVSYGVKDISTDNLGQWLYCHASVYNKGVAAPLGNIISSSVQSNFSDAYFATFTPKAPKDYTFSAASDFGLTSDVTAASTFTYLDDLPYGDNTTVLSYTYGTFSYQIFVNDEVETVSMLNWSPWNNNATLYIASKDPIYRVGYNTTTGSLISFYSIAGLVQCSDMTPSGGLTDTYYYLCNYYLDNGYYLFYYTLPTGNFSCTVSNNNSNLIFDTSGPYTCGFGSYPSLSSAELDTQKGMWETLKELPSNIANSIKGFFAELGDKIGGFFESLKNYLLYFQETKPEHVNPFAGILDNVQSFFDDKIGDTEDFKTSLNDTLNDVSSYIETGSNIINRILEGVPVLNAFVIFILVFAVVRKVVGR